MPAEYHPTAEPHCSCLVVELPPGVERVKHEAFQRAIRTAAKLFASGNPAALIGTVSGTDSARRFWQRSLETTRVELGAQEALALHEDLPVNQAFGLLLLWQRVRERQSADSGSLFTFVFGEGSRASPFTEAECGQKPAIASFVRRSTAGSGRRRYSSVAELSLRSFAPVESYLRRSGFDGLVVKWGDEIQIPTRDLNGSDPRFADADVVRFVSMREITDSDARHKDWVGVASDGTIEAFIPRRALHAMEPLADRGWLQRRGKALVGGINLGSIGVSRALLDLLLEEFYPEVNDSNANRSQRPDLDPQFFTALVIACSSSPKSRWEEACAESEALRSLASTMPTILDRLLRVHRRFTASKGRAPKLVALDFEDQYWGDAGQHRQIFDFYSTLLSTSAEGSLARALACVPERQDECGNRIVGDCRLGPDVNITNSVIIDAEIHSGRVNDSVLLGTRCRQLRAAGAFDVESMADELSLDTRSGTYKVVSSQKLVLAPGERATSVFLSKDALLMRVHESTDLRDRARNYDLAFPGNPLSFRELHQAVARMDPTDIENYRECRREKLRRVLNFHSA